MKPETEFANALSDYFAIVDDIAMPESNIRALELAGEKLCGIATEIAKTNSDWRDIVVTLSYNYPD
jgi:hypothetical protein